MDDSELASKIEDIIEIIAPPELMTRALSVDVWAIAMLAAMGIGVAAEVLKSTTKNH